MSVSRRNLLAGIALGLPLAACGAKPFTIDPNIKYSYRCQRARQDVLWPIADSRDHRPDHPGFGPPGRSPAEQIASQVAHAFCDHVQPLMARRGVRRQGIEPSSGRVILDYGQVVINGKPVNITVYAMLKLRSQARSEANPMPWGMAAGPPS